MEIFKTYEEAEKYCEENSGEYDTSCGCGCFDYQTVEEELYIFDDKVYNRITTNNNGDIDTWTEIVGELRLSN